MILHFYSDPGHGWLAAPKRLIARLGIADKISSYSYQSATMVQLEEDCDAGILINALRDAGIPYQIREHSTNRYSRIRSFHHYTPGGG